MVAQARESRIWFAFSHRSPRRKTCKTRLDPSHPSSFRPIGGIFTFSGVNMGLAGARANASFVDGGRKFVLASVSERSRWTYSSITEAKVTNYGSKKGRLQRTTEKTRHPPHADRQITRRLQTAHMVDNNVECNDIILRLWRPTGRSSSDHYR